MQPPVAANGQNNPFNNPSTEGMDHRLIGMTPGELITIILSMRSSHEQQVSELQNRYEAASRQLEQLTHTLNGHFASQIAALQSVQQVGLFGIRGILAKLTKCDRSQSVASISASEQTRSLSSTIAAVPNATNGGLALPPTNPSFSAPRQTPVPPIVAAPPSTPTANNLRTTSTPRSARFETPSVAAFTPSRTATSASVEPQDKKDLKITQSDTPNQPPTVEASHLDTAWEAWEEFRYGRNGNPSLETLDAIWGPRWRQDFKLREFYKRRKAIADKIKQYMADGIDEQSAVRALDTQRGKRKLNWLSLRILDERKAQKEQYKEAQKAALVNKAALQNLGNAPAAAAGANMSPPQTQHTL
jgi:hypothetical protein